MADKTCLNCERLQRALSEAAIMRHWLCKLDEAWPLHEGEFKDCPHPACKRAREALEGVNG